MSNGNGKRTVRNRLLLALAAAALVGIGAVVGALAAGGDDDKHTATEPLATNSAAAIGDAAIGRKLFVSQHCSDCHSLQGKGGEDAPPLDFMKGKLTAKDIANMTGTIWNHEPIMIKRFKAEGIPFPTFSGDEMADLIAYLHGGGPPPDVGKASEHDEDAHGEGANDEHSHSDSANDEHSHSDSN